MCYKYDRYPSYYILHVYSCHDQDITEDCLPTSSRDPTMGRDIFRWVLPPSIDQRFFSTEANPANPGGFTIFMSHPKSVDMGAKAFDSTAATLREYFGMDVDKSTVEY